ncbi:MAG: RDD family protein [Candidatus Acidiferrales bacterium]
MYCSKCGTAVSDGAAFCGACGQSTGATGAVQTQVGVLPPPPLPPQAQTAAPIGVLYAGFWLRVVAAIIDYLILGIPYSAICVAVFAGALPELMRMQAEPMVVLVTFLPRIIFIAVLYIVGAWLYWAGMEGSKWQATLGKKALGLYVTDMEGHPATFGRTSGRFWAGRGIGIVPYLGGLYFLISCIMAGFTERKQALHDMIANCLVLRKA